MIDVHAHVGVPGAALTASQADGFAGHQAATQARYQNPLTAEYMRTVSAEWDRLLTDLSARVRRMDDAGVAVQLISVNPGQYYYWAGPAAAHDLVRQVNEHLAGIVSARPDRFLGLGTVALQHPGLAAAQLREAVTDFGFAGVQISTQAGGRDLSAPEFEPLWDAAEEHDAVVLIHPLGCPQLTDRLAPAYLNNIIGQPLETTIALSHLIFTGVLDRHPDLRICAAHGGGYLPYYLGRSERAYLVRPDSATMEHPPVYYLRRMWFDSVVHSAAVAKGLVDLVGADRLVVGSDYPFDMGSERPGALVDDIPGLTEAQRTAIRDGNALTLLGRHGRRLAAASA
jgi:aminocarboxymuconate-semialdehyde decarboxylase